MMSKYLLSDKCRDYYNMVESFSGIPKSEICDIDRSDIVDISFQREEECINDSDGEYVEYFSLKDFKDIPRLVRQIRSRKNREAGIDALCNIIEKSLLAVHKDSIENDISNAIDYNIASEHPGRQKAIIRGRD